MSYTLYAYCLLNFLKAEHSAIRTSIVMTYYWAHICEVPEYSKAFDWVKWILIIVTMHYLVIYLSLMGALFGLVVIWIIVCCVKLICNSKYCFYNIYYYLTIVKTIFPCFSVTVLIISSCTRPSMVTLNIFSGMYTDVANIAKLCCKYAVTGGTMNISIRLICIVLCRL